MSIVSDTDARAYLGLDDDDTALPILKPLVERAVNQWLGWEVEQASYTRYYPLSERGGEYNYFPSGDDPAGIVSSAGGSTNILCLDHKYVRLSQLQVWEHSGAFFGQAESFSSDDLLTRGTQYVLDTEDGSISKTGHLIRLGADWPRERGSVKVTYTAGFTAAELAGEGGSYNASDIRLAVLLTLQKVYNQRTAQLGSATTGAAGTLISETIPGYSYRVDPGTSIANLGMVRTLPLEAMHLLYKYRRLWLRR